MGLKITGSVKQGNEGVVARVELKIFDKETQRVMWEGQSNTGDDGTFYEEILDSTGIARDFKGHKLLGTVMGDLRFSREEKTIPGSEVQLHFVIRDRWKDLVQRMLGASLLKRDVIGQVSEAANALPQALAVAVVACLSFGAIFGARGGLGAALLAGLLVLIPLSVCVVATYWIGTTVLATDGTATTFAKYLRPTGFAATPLLIAAIIFAVLLAIGAPSTLLNVLFVGVLIWLMLTLAAAVRLALGYGKQWWRAFLAVLVPPLTIVAVFWWLAVRASD